MSAFFVVIGRARKFLLYIVYFCSCTLASIEEKDTLWLSSTFVNLDLFTWHSEALVDNIRVSFRGLNFKMNDF